MSEIYFCFRRKSTLRSVQVVTVLKSETRFGNAIERERGEASNDISEEVVQVVGPKRGTVRVAEKFKHFFQGKRQNKTQ